MAEFTLRELQTLAKKNPTADWVPDFVGELERGAFDSVARSEGIDISSISPTYKQSIEQDTSKVQDRIQERQGVRSEKIQGLKQEIKAAPAMEDSADTRRELLATRATSGAETASNLLNLTAFGEGLGAAADNIRGKISKKYDSVGEIYEKRLDSLLSQQDDILGRLKVAKDSNDIETIGKLESLLQQTGDDLHKLDVESSERINELPSNKEVIGSALSLATLAVGGKVAKGAGSLATKAIPSLATPATSVIGGIAKGAAKGAATAAPIGALEGVGRGITQEKDAKGVVGQSLKESALAGVGGALVGGAIGGVTTKKALAPKKAQDEMLDFIQKKKLSSAEDLIAREQGRLQDATLLKGEKLAPTKREIEMAQAAQGIVDPKAGLKKNMDNIKKSIISDSKKVDSLYEKEVITALTDARVDEAVKTLKETSSGKILFTPGTSEEKAYDALVDVYKAELKKAGGNPIVARRNFDKIGKQRLPNAFKRLSTDSITNVKEQAFIDIRNLGNELAFETLPDTASKEVANLLRKQSLLYNLRTNIALNSQGITKLKPSKVKALLKSQGVRAGLASAVGAGSLGAILK